MRKKNAKSSNAIDVTESSEEGGFFRRWSQRKGRVRGGHAREATARVPDDAPKAEESDASAEPERVLTDDDMPSLDSLNEESDYSGFMSPGVSESMRKLALRKMFLSSKYNFTDGLDDYAEDFTQFAQLGDIITSDMRHKMETEAERAKQKLEQESRAAVDEAPAGEGAGTATAASEAPEGGDGGEDPEPVAGEDSQIRESAGAAPTDDDSRSG